MNFKIFLIQYHFVKVYNRITFSHRQVFRFCASAFYPLWQLGQVGLLRELSFWQLLICFLIRLENIQAVNYVETTVEWKQWAIADSDSD